MKNPPTQAEDPAEKPATEPPNQKVVSIAQGYATARDHFRNGRNDEAAAIYRAILEADPNHLASMHNLALIIRDEGDLEKAVEVFNKILTINPEFAEAYLSMGSTLNAAGRSDAAIDCFKKALALRPDYVQAHINLANCLSDREEFEPAILHLRKAISLSPENAAAHYNLGAILYFSGQLDDALSSSRQAIALNPDFADAHLNLSVILLKQGHLDDSLAAAEKALSLAPDSPGAHTAVANVLRDFGRFDEAITHYRQAIDLKGDFEEAHSNLLMTLHYPPSTISEDFLAAATAWAKPYNDACPRPTFANKADPDKRLRVGYVSADFSKHPVGFYLERILPFHKLQAVEYVGYCNSLKVDETTERLQQNSVLWRKITNLSDAALAEQIRQDNIDILIDLSGHTAGNRLGAFALRPAPVQVTWMGYTGTTGLKAMDHILADRFVVRDGEEDLFSEQVTFLPGCYLNFDPPRLDITTAPPPATKSGFITFGSFNNRVKITDEAIAAWSQILIDVPKSRLLLKTAQLDDDGVRQSLLDQFRSHDIDEDRLDLEGRSPREELLRAYQRVDIALDTRPFSGGVTTAEALWMGIPVITLRSNRWSGRLGETILNGSGMAELVAESPQQYHDLAVTLAGDLSRLETLHAELREKLIASPFCDGPAFASKLETAYREMWQTWCAEEGTHMSSEKDSSNENDEKSNDHPAGKHVFSIDQAADMAREHSQNGRNAEAEDIYRSILRVDPNNTVAMHNLALIIRDGENPEQAIALFKQALSIDPEFAEAYLSMGETVHLSGHPDVAITYYRKALAIRPDYVQAHINLGNSLSELEQNEEAIGHLRQALALSPNDAIAHYNLARVLFLDKQTDEAAGVGRQAVASNPDSVEAHINLTLIELQRNNFTEALESSQRAFALAPGSPATHLSIANVLQKQGRFGEALTHYRQVIELNPNHNEAWALLERLIKAALFNEGLNRRGDDRYGQGFTQTIQAGYHFALLQYYLDAFRPHEADASYDAALGALPDRGAVPGPAQDGKPPVLFEQTIALLHFGRSGTGLVHSLIDSHPEVSTVPSVYLSGYFNDGLWKELSAGPIETLPDRFAQNFAVMFDATSLNLTPSSNPEGIAGLGVKEGMTDVGEDHDRSLSVDREVFCDEARRLMAQFGSIDAGQFLQIAHAAYETALGRTNDKHTLFYHIHNPNRFAKLNFLRHQPDARLIMMIRDPVQSCESWVRRAFEDGQYMPVLLRILTMLYDIDQVAFRRHDCVGVRLEDLKRKPEATMKALCQWIGIAENPCLYEMTAQGEKWWGDHSSPDYDKKKQMTPFDDAGLKRPGRAIFSETDLFLLETLFYPFSVRFGYKEPDPGGFKQNLKEVRALLGGSLDIEKVIVDKTDVDREQFERQNDYLRFRAGLIDRLDVLDEVGEYPHMLAPLNVSKKI